MARLLLIALCALAVCGGMLPSALAAQIERPNIVYVLTDDQGWNDIGYHGSDVMTPNIDRLAAEGAKLEQFYAYTTCSPTRVGLLTGRNPARFGVLAPLGATTKVQPGDAILPQTLKRLGYTTHITGKWHIGETPEHRPLKYGFTTSYGYLRGQIDPYTHRYKFGNHITWHRNDEFIEEPGHVTDLIADEAVRVIESAGDQPFFLYIAHHSPHYPINESPQWIEPYEDKIEDIWRRHFAASITHVDATIGRIIDALDRTGLRKRTIFVYSSDNGGQKSWSAPEREYNGRYAAHTTLGDNTPLRGWKTDLYEGGIRVPAFVNWPGQVPAGRTVSGVTHVLDWAPTLIRLAGGEVDPEWKLDGDDIWPLISGQSDSLGTRSFYWHTPRDRAVRQGDWKLVVTGRDQRKAELFHLADDPNETTDLAARQPQRVEELKKLFEALSTGR
jgi:arylsulfatase A-like enzyme